MVLKYHHLEVTEKRGMDIVATTAKRNMPQLKKKKKEKDYVYGKKKQFC
jgi:hypothetical protein